MAGSSFRLPNANPLQLFMLLPFVDMFQQHQPQSVPGQTKDSWYIWLRPKKQPVMFYSLLDISPPSPMSHPGLDHINSWAKSIILCFIQQTFLSICVPYKIIKKVNVDAAQPQDPQSLKGEERHLDEKHITNPCHKSHKARHVPPHKVTVSLLQTEKLHTGCGI